MESVKKCLRFNSSAVQMQGMKNLQLLVQEKLAKSSTLGFHSTQKVPSELEYLLILGCHPDFMVAGLAQQSLLELIKESLIDVCGCVHQLVLLSSTAQHTVGHGNQISERTETPWCLTSLLGCVVTLLPNLIDSSMKHLPGGDSDDQTAQGEAFQSTHPFISLLKNLDSSTDFHILIIQAYSNSLFLNADENLVKSAELFDYHMTFIRHVIEEKNSGMISLTVGVLRETFSYYTASGELDHILSSVLDVIANSQDLLSIRTAAYLDVIWSQSIDMLSPPVTHRLIRYSLACMCSGQHRCVKAWIALSSYIQLQQNQCCLRGYELLITRALVNHLKADAKTLHSILILAQATICENPVAVSNRLLLVPLLKLLATHNSTDPTYKQALEVAKICLSVITETLHSDAASSTDSTDQDEPVTVSLGVNVDWYLNELRDAEILLSTVCEYDWYSTEKQAEFLNSVLCQLKENGLTSPSVLYILASVLTSTSDTDTHNKVLEILSLIADQQPEQVSDILLLITHWLKSPLDPEVVLKTLVMLPSFAVNKYNCPAVLLYLEQLTETPKSLSLYIRLLCDVTKYQSKAYHKLLHVLKSTSDRMEFAVKLARMLAVKHICDDRPGLYGTEVLPYISASLELTSDSDSPLVRTALESLSLLVQADVVDIKTIWDVLGDQFMSEQREGVLVGICDFLSLSSLYDDSASKVCQEFKETTVDLLWMYSRHEYEAVVSAAYKALSLFPYDSIKYKHLPAEIVIKYAGDYAGNTEKYDTEPVEPSAFLSLIFTSRTAKTAGYRHLLQAFIRQEVDEFGVGLSRMKLASRPKRNVPKCIQEVPRRLTNLYKNQRGRPATESTSNITTAMLLCLQFSAMKDSPSTSDYRQAIASSRQSLDQLTHVIRGCNPPTLNRSQLNHQLITGWRQYMTCVLQIVIQGRMAEGKLANQPYTYWESIFRGKDMVETSIITSSKGHDSECNALIALTSLISAVRDLVSAVDIDSRKELPTTYTAFEQNTITALLSVANDILDRDLLPWVTSVSHLTTRVTSWLCLASVAPLAYSDNTRLLSQVLQMFDKSTTYSTAEVETAPYYLSILLRSLLDQNIQDLCPGQISEQISSLLDHMLTPEMLMSGSGADALLHLLPSIISEKSRSDQIQLILLQIQSKSEDSPTQAEISVRGTVACCLYFSNLFEGNLDKECQFMFDNCNSSQVSSTLGYLVNCMVAEFHPASAKWLELLSAHWFGLLKSTQMVDILVAIDGLMALAGVQSFQVSTGHMMSEKEIQLCEIIGDQLSQLNNDLNTKYYSWILSWLHYSLSNIQSGTGSTQPLTYKHTLSSTSLVRAVVEQLRALSKSRNDDSLAQSALLIDMLREACMRKQLPPLHWSALLTSYMRQPSELSSKIQKDCLLIAASQCKACNLCTAFITKWCSIQLFNSLQREGKFALISNLHKFIDSVKLEAMQKFTAHLLDTFYKKDEDRDLIESLFRSMKMVVSSPESYKPASIVFIYKLLDTCTVNLQLSSQYYLDNVRLMGDCLSVCEVSLLEEIRSNADSNYTYFHLTIQLTGENSSAGQIIDSLHRLPLDLCDTDWLLHVLNPCWTKLSKRESMAFIMETQKLIETCPEPKSAGFWLTILSAAILKCNGGRLPPAADIYTVFDLHLTQLFSKEPWSQLLKQTSKWIHTMTKSSVLKGQWLEAFRSLDSRTSYVRG